MKSKITQATLLAVLFSLFIGSAQARESAKEKFDIDPLPQKTTLRIAYFSGSVHALSNYIAAEKGWFKDAGLEVELIPFINGPAIMEAKRSWDVGTTGAPGVISGVIGQDVSMIGLAVWDNILDLYVRPDHPIAKAGKGHVKDYPELYGRPDDWKGTQWLLPAGTTMHLVILTTLERLGLTEKDVRIANMDVTSAYTAFKANQGDGLGVWTTLAIMAQENSNIKVSGIKECGSRMATAVFANEDALKNKYDAVKKYLEVYLATASWLDGNIDEGTELYVQTCEEEGVATNSKTARKTLSLCNIPPFREQLKYVETMVADPRNPSKQISEYEKIIMDTFDFFASQGRYEDKDREKMLSGFLLKDVLLDIKADYDKAGKKVN